MEMPIGEISREKKESTPSFKDIRKELSGIVEIEDIAEMEGAMREAISGFRRLEERDGTAVAESLDWFEENNHRINLYMIGGQTNEGWKDEPADKIRGEHLLALKKMDLCLKQMAEMDDEDRAAERLENIIRHEGLPAHSVETAVYSLARTGVAGGAALERMVKDEELPQSVRVRAAMAGLRYGEVPPDFKAACLPVLQGLIESAEPLDMYRAVEMCGIISGDEAKAALETIGRRISDMKEDQAIFVKRDWISTSLAVDAAFEKRVGAILSGKTKIVEGICFGSTDGMPDFDAFMEANREKIEAMVKALKRTNSAFGHEPVLFVDIVNDSRENLANEGWSANSLYISRTLTEHPRVTTNNSVHGLIHEACERWDSKGFVDAEMERDYLKMMGPQYDGSLLDKFRLKHRIDIPSHAGHPWDGTREYMAETGSILLADPTAIERIFNTEQDGEALACLDSVRQKIKKYKDRR